VVAKKYFTELSLSDIDQLLKSPVHELRFTALEALVMQYEQGTKAEKEKVYKFYLQHATRVNNWDLVDTSCREIVGEHLLTRPRKVLYKLAKSMNIWERRISIVSTYAFILEGQVLDTFALSDLLKKDTHDLIHKAVGWMLREAGKQSSFALETYLASRYKTMNRTTLRYAIERFSPSLRKQYLSGTVVSG
jgi:3-methyladenine DNA glycosylase AlkD